MTGSLTIKLGSSGGGSTAWGAITGTLSNQTDLQAAIDLKASLSGATFTGTVVAPALRTSNAIFPTRTLELNTGAGVQWSDVNGSGFSVVIRPDAPSTNRTINFNPNGNFVSTADVGTVTDTMLAGSIAPSKVTGTAAILGANTFTALQQFSGTTHAGLRLNNLTTAERDAIASPQAGMAIWNTTAARLQLHNGSAWTAGMVRLDGDTMTGALTIATGTITAAANPFAITQTWNNAAVTFQGPKITFTDTASAITEEYFGIYGGAAGATKLFSVSKTGGANGVEVASLRSTSSTWALDVSVAGLSLGSARRVCWSSTVNYYDTNDLFLSRKAAATLQLGLDAAGVTNQMFTAASRITSDGVGADLTIAPGNGRGGAGGTLILSTFSTAGASTIGTLTSRMTIDTAGAVAFPNVTAVTTETVTSDRTWPVTINGVAYKICLKA